MGERAEMIREAFGEIEAEISEALGEWEGVQIPYCPEWCRPYKDLSEMIDGIKAALPDAMESERKKGVTQGIALACAHIADRCPEIAKDILRDAGMLQESELIENEVDEYDIEKLSGLLEQDEDHDDDAVQE